MSTNAFGVVTGIFLVLFGIGYKGETFPGGYKGRETALISLGLILLALIGYCGVSLVSYAITVIVAKLLNLANRKSKGETTTKRTFIDESTR